VKNLVAGEDGIGDVVIDHAGLGQVVAENLRDLDAGPFSRPWPSCPVTSAGYTLKVTWRASEIGAAKVDHTVELRWLIQLTSP